MFDFVYCFKGAGVGGLHDFFSEIEFLAVSDRGDRYLSESFGPMKNIDPSRSYNSLEVSATVLSVIVLHARFSIVCSENRP